MNHLTEKTKRYLLSHCTELSRVNDLSIALGVSYDHLRKIFVRETGTSLIEYLNIMRIERAKNFLGDHEKKLYTIAHAVGYTNEHTLIRNFKKVTGMTPTEYRKKLNGNYQSIKTERSLEVPRPPQRNPKMTTNGEHQK
ncbi:MAG: helix-turn-helix transcriptional regulator [Ignavibacteriales bacterium]|nr:helix-turn-helix transcriptional regulator [Ignavibacteriales bacterium]